MSEQITWATGKKGIEDVLLGFDSEVLAFHGQLGSLANNPAERRFRPMRPERAETAAGYLINSALAMHFLEIVTKRESRFSRPIGDLEPRPPICYGAGACVGRRHCKAEVTRRRSGQILPYDTAVRFNYLPALHAQLALNRGDTAVAIESLQMTSSQELMIPGGPTLTLLCCRFLYVERRT